MARRYLCLLSAFAMTAGWLLLPAAVSADPLSPRDPVITTPAKPAPSSTGGHPLAHSTWQIDKGSHPDQAVVKVSWTPVSALSGAPSPDPAPPPPAAGCSSTSSTSLDCSIPWPLFRGKYVLNGTYRIDASGRLYNEVLGPHYSGTVYAKGTIAVANPPLPTANVAAVAQTDPPAVSITWDPNPEPDVYAYAVFRLQDKKLVGEVGHCEVAAAGSNSCPNPPALLDTTSGGGTFSYQVLAYRYGATYSAADALSASSAPTKAVTVAGPPAPTTTTVATGGPATSATAALGAAAGLGATGSGSAATSFPSLAPSFSAPTTAPGPAASSVPSVEPASPDPAVVGAARGSPAEFGSHHQSVGNWGAVAAGLLLVVLAMGGLWLRGQVKHAGVLEPVEPGGT